MDQPAVALVRGWTHHRADGAAAPHPVEPHLWDQLVVSSRLCACIPNNLDFLKYDWKSESWNLVFAGGVLIGAFLAASFFSTDAPIALSESAIARFHELGIQDLNGQHPADIFSWDRLSDPRTLLFVIVGGFLVGFGTRYAGGCTSGHAIMGLSHFQLPSFVAVLGFFTGGLIMSWLILPLILT